jgi:hypothetical protein
MTCLGSAIAVLKARQQNLEEEIHHLKFEIRDLDFDDDEELDKKRKRKAQAELELAVADAELHLHDAERDSYSDHRRVEQLKEEFELAIKRLKLHEGERDNPNNPELNDLRREIEKAETEAEGSQSLAEDNIQRAQLRWRRVLLFVRTAVYLSLRSPHRRRRGPVLYRAHLSFKMVSMIVVLLIRWHRPYRRRILHRAHLSLERACMIVVLLIRWRRAYRRRMGSIGPTESSQQPREILNHNTSPQVYFKDQNTELR